MQENTTPRLSVSSLTEIPCPDKCNEAIISMNPLLAIKSWNKSAERIYGVQRHEAMDKSLDEVIVFAFVEDSLASFVQKLSQRGQWQGEMMFIRKDRVVKFTYVTVNAVYDQFGVTIGYVAIIREDAKNIPGRTCFTPIFDTEYRFVGLISKESSHNWEMVLHWED
jgi:PAS domain S-box-containing protein